MDFICDKLIMAYILQRERSISEDFGYKGGSMNAYGYSIGERETEREKETQEFHFMARRSGAKPQTEEYFGSLVHGIPTKNYGTSR